MADVRQTRSGDLLGVFPLFFLRLYPRSPSPEVLSSGITTGWALPTKISWWEDDGKSDPRSDAAHILY